MIQQLITCASSLSFVFQIYKYMQKLKNDISNWFLSNCMFGLQSVSSGNCSFPLQRERKLNVTPPTVFEQWPQLKVCQRGCEEKHQVDKGVKNEYIGKALTDVNLSVGRKDHLAHILASFQQKVPFLPKHLFQGFVCFTSWSDRHFLCLSAFHLSHDTCHERNLPSFSN